MKILALIPARGGSKGIKNKNITDLNGKPLIVYTIEATKEVEENITKIAVTTDSKKIAQVAKSQGIEVIKRPDKISGDKANSVSFILHALDYFRDRNMFFDVVLVLQPTSPFRSSLDINQAIRIFNKNDSTSLISCVETQPLSTFYFQSGPFAIGVSKDHSVGQRRQDYNQLFMRNGAIYMVKVSYVSRYKKLISNKPTLFLMPKERSINIDNKEDLDLAKKML